METSVGLGYYRSTHRIKAAQFKGVRQPACSYLVLKFDSQVDCVSCLIWLLLRSRLRAQASLRYIPLYSHFSVKLLTDSHQSNLEVSCLGT